VLERDRHTAPRRDANVRPQDVSNRCVERDLFAKHRVGEQKRREQLRDRPNLEQARRVRRNL
jgi:hypothetical protein